MQKFIHLTIRQQFKQLLGNHFNELKPAFQDFFQLLFQAEKQLVDLCLLVCCANNIALYYSRMRVIATYARPDNVVVADVDGLRPDDLYQCRSIRRRRSCLGGWLRIDTANSVWLRTGGLGTMLLKMLLDNAVHI